MQVECLYEFRNMSDLLEVNSEIICDVIEHIQFGYAWGCLGDDGISIFIQKGRIVELSKIKFLICNEKEVLYFNLLSNKNELIKLLNERVFGEGHTKFDHYQFVGVLDIMEQFGNLSKNMAIAKKEGLWGMNIIEE